MDSNSLSHTKWNCKYHIVFAPKSVSISVKKKRLCTSTIETAGYRTVLTVV